MAQKERLIESCCTERLLPALLRDAKDGTATWLTMGDVTLRHVFVAVSSLAGPNHVMTLVMRRPDLQTMRWVRHWMERDWTRRLLLLSREDCRELVSVELGGLTGKVVLAVDETVDDEMVAFEGERGTVVVCGRMLSVVEAGIRTYAGYFGGERGVMRELLEATEARIKRHRVEVSLVAKTSEVAVAQPHTEPAQMGTGTSVPSEIAQQEPVPTVSPTVSPKKSKGKKADVQTSPDPS